MIPGPVTKDNSAILSYSMTLVGNTGQPSHIMWLSRLVGLTSILHWLRVGNTIDWKNFVLKMFIFHVIVCAGLILVAEHTQKLNTLKYIKCSSGSPREMPCCFSCTKLSGILANYRRQSRSVLVRTLLTSSHTFSCLPHLLITSVIVLVGMA